MRTTKTITVGGREVLVRELIMREIADLSAGPGDKPVETMTRLITCSTDVTPAYVADSAPSELAKLVEAMIEVNADFFAQARAVGMEETAKLLEDLIRKIFIVAFLLSSGPDTVQ